MTAELLAKLDALHKRLWDAGLIDHVENQTINDVAKVLKGPLQAETWATLEERHTAERIAHLRAAGVSTLAEMQSFIETGAR